jgi:bifunctional DNase/RNase
MTHELLLNTIKQLGYQVQQVEIDAVNSDTYFSTIKLTPRGSGPRTKDERSIDARPSDAIALALAAGAPIFASPEVIEAGAVEFASEESEVDSGEFKKFIDEVKASDFNIPGLSVKALEDEESDPGEDRWKV